MMTLHPWGSLSSRLTVGPGNSLTERSIVHSVAYGALYKTLRRFSCWWGSISLPSRGMQEEHLPPRCVCCPDEYAVVRDRTYLAVASFLFECDAIHLALPLAETRVEFGKRLCGLRKSPLFNLHELPALLLCWWKTFKAGDKLQDRGEALDSLVDTAMLRILGTQSTHAHSNARPHTT
jgi:hypothetical protein